jgi:phosphinothricin acetyltransferase
MTDFVRFEPSARSPRAGAAVTIRKATSADVDGLSAVMAVRGGTAAEHRERADRLLERLPVLSVAEAGIELVGWSGAQPFEIEPGSSPEWLVAGLTVVPAYRRRGIAARLLQDVVEEVQRSAAGEPVYSVINAQNLASIELHKGLGFEEVGRAAKFASVEFTGGEGVLLRRAGMAHRAADPDR